MDVRCERCRAQYVFDDEQVTLSGLTVQCTHCGHVFMVKKKELVVTVPVRPDEVEGIPLPATAAAPRAGGSWDRAESGGPSAEAERLEWRVRQASGNVLTFRELTTLQKWVVERKVSRDDALSRAGGPWQRLGQIAELETFFRVVEAAARAQDGAGHPGPAPVPLASVTAVYGAAGQPTGLPPPPSGFPPPSFTRAAPARPAVSAAPPRVPSPRPAPSEEVSLDDDELAAVKGRGRGPVLAVVALLAVAGTAAAYVFWPPGRRAAAPSSAIVAVPITIEVPSTPAPSSPGPAIPPAGEAVPAATAAPAAPAAIAAVAQGQTAAPTVAADPVAVAPPRGAAGAGAAPKVAPVPAAEPAPPEPAKAAAPTQSVPMTPRALLAQAEKLRERDHAERALDLYARVLDAEPDNAAALAGRGLCYLDLEQYAPAEASFRAALKAAPGHPDALMGLAETYRGQGRKPDALQYYERYLALHPGGEEAAVARNAIEELRR